MLKIKKHALGEYYHVYSRGMQKQPIFVTDKDRLRFLFLLLTFQGKKSISNISRELKQNVQSQTLNILPRIEKDVLTDRTVELVNFCLMPNHFHLLVQEKTEGGIAKYMQRVLTSYTKYFNLKYQKSGHLLESTYRSVLMKDDLQLMHTSAYIHKNPKEIAVWKENYAKYPWSSLQDYVDTNRFGKLLSTNIVLDRYNNTEKASSYADFVKTSTAKEDLINL